MHEDFTMCLCTVSVQYTFLAVVVASGSPAFSIVTIIIITGASQVAQW